MSTHPQTPRGSDADVAEAGLDVEAAFAEVDGQTAHRLAMEARAHQEQQGGAPASSREGHPAPAGKGPLNTTKGETPYQNVPREPSGPSALDMLSSPVGGRPQDPPDLEEDLWYVGEGLMAHDALETSPNQEGPPGT